MAGRSRRLRCAALGGDPSAPLGSPGAALRLEEAAERPALGAGEVRIRVHAAGLNFADALVVAGTYQEKPELPFTPGSEASGVVVEIGERATDTGLKVGDRVVAALPALGGFADEAVAPAAACQRLPEGVDLVAAAGLPVAFGTTHVALAHRAGLKRGETLLVLGAAGGVGTAAVQLGKAMGATVVAAARGAEKTKALLELGADVAVDTQGLDGKALAAALKKACKGGADVVYDPVGGDAFRASLKAVRWGARILVIGFASGDIPKLPLNIALVKNVTVHGVYWGSYMKHEPRTLVESQRELVRMLADGSLSVKVSHTFPLERAPEAFSVLLGRGAVGKVVLVPGGVGAGGAGARARL